MTLGFPAAPVPPGPVFSFAELAFTCPFSFMLLTPVFMGSWVLLSAQGPPVGSLAKPGLPTRDQAGRLPGVASAVRFPPSLGRTGPGQVLAGVTGH